VVVLTTTESIAKYPGWSTAQDELAALSTNSSHRIVDTTHVGVLVTTAGSDNSIRAITDVITAIRSGDHLAGH
jgi:hypothetical protein